MPHVKIYNLKNKHGMTAKISNYGGILMSLNVADKNGDFDDIVLGYDTIEEYVESGNEPYFGAIIGRYANRIANGQFTLNKNNYKLARNNYPNHLHGGVKGFDKVLWNAKEVSGKDYNSLELTYLSKNGEEGYPGNLSCKVIYKLSDENSLSIYYKATTDKATPINLTHHSYFNLSGQLDTDVLDHQLTIEADEFTPVDKTLVPTSLGNSVEGTPFDFRKPKRLGDTINQHHDQLILGSGFDHNYILAGNKTIRVTDDLSGRVMEVKTDQPCVQFYTANHLTGQDSGKGSKPYQQHAGFCLETQHAPDSPNQNGFPNTILDVGECYETTTEYSFYCLKQ